MMFFLFFIFILCSKIEFPLMKMILTLIPPNKIHRKQSELWIHFDSCKTLANILTQCTKLPTSNIIADNPRKRWEETTKDKENWMQQEQHRIRKLKIVKMFGNCFANPNKICNFGVQPNSICCIYTCLQGAWRRWVMCCFNPLYGYGFISIYSLQFFGVFAALCFK